MKLISLRPCSTRLYSHQSLSLASLFPRPTNTMIAMSIRNLDRRRRTHTGQTNNRAGGVHDLPRGREGGAQI